MNKYTLPRLSGQGGKLFRRSTFLDGKVKTYFAPGQPPYMIGTLDPKNNGGVWSVGTPATSDEYVNPDDWPKAGYILRPPQQVWLEIRIGPAGTTDTGHDPFVHEWTDFSTSPSELRWETQPNFGRAEHHRLASLFSSVKSTIEAVRPQKTFVRISNWCQETNLSSVNYDGINSPLVESWDCEIDGHMVAVNETFGASHGSGFIEAPAYAGSYFGTDFLHVYCGDSIIQNVYMNTEYGSSDPSFPIDGSISAVDLAGNAFWQAVYAKRLKPNVSKFHRYSCRLYHPPDQYQLWMQRDIPPNPADDNANVGNGTLKLWQASKYNFDEAASIAALDKIDITHPGESSKITDASYLVKLIASHFGFDPATGRDL